MISKPHYFPPEHGSPVIDIKAMTVVDIGCQYKCGTTDTTRTFHWSPKHASREEKRAFTRVLQGHAALDMAVFPEGTTGAQLDVLARAPMWQDGRNYTHGTGHGIGVRWQVSPAKISTVAPELMAAPHTCSH